MDLKEQLIQLKNKLLGRKIEKEQYVPDSKSDIKIIDLYDEEGKVVIGGKNELNISVAAISEHFKKKYDRILDNKVENFIDVYEKNIKGSYTLHGEFRKPKELRDFIEKMAIWYEIKYMYSEVMDLFDGKAIEKTWKDEMCKIENFIETLSYNERSYLLKPKYNKIVNITNTIHFHLTEEGTIIEAEYFGDFTKGKITEEQVLYKNIKDVYAMLQEEQIELPEICEVEKEIRRFDERVAFREELLNCVMYRIIERGGNRIGPRRGFLFAEEFNRNIDIPVMYGIDTSDPKLRDFINVYINAGGNPDLECFINYHSRENDNGEFEIATVRDMIRITRNDYINVYTNEERELQQGLVDVLSSQINPEELRKEQVKQLRLERKLKKSKQSR